MMFPALVSPPPPPPAAAAPPPSPSVDGTNPSLLIVAAIIVFVFVASASIHLLLRCLCRQPHSPSSTSAPFVFLRRHLSSSSSSSFSSSSPAAAAPPSPRDDPTDWLPLFTLASSLAALPRSSPDCAVCLSRFYPDDELRLLPACRHAFHSTCIDTWLSYSLSCPLCRSPIPQGPLPPPPPPPQPQAVPAPSAATATASDRSGSYHVEIGSVSRRRTAEGDAPAPPPPSRSYSLGSSFEYIVEDEVEAVVSALAAHVRQQRQSKDLPASAPGPPGDSVAESAGGGGSRNWLRDYLDRLASSASSSFSSLRFSERESRRVDGGAAVAGGESWDPEGNHRGWPGEGEEEIAGAYNTFYRWLVGA